MATLAESYSNTLYEGHTSLRRWITPGLMIGGSITGGQDWCHLRDDFGINAVINVESEHSDTGKGIPEGALLEAPTPDDASPKPADWWATILVFARQHAAEKIYVHCQQGGSRSPAVAYAILRDRGYSPEDALVALRDGEVQWYGSASHHVNYLASFESAFLALT